MREFVKMVLLVITTLILTIILGGIDVLFFDTPIEVYNSTAYDQFGRFVLVLPAYIAMMKFWNWLMPWSEEDTPDEE